MVPGAGALPRAHVDVEHDRLQGAEDFDVRTRLDGKLEHVHTLNGTAVTARTMIALMENFQEADGSVSVPEPLWEHGAPRRLGGERVAS